LLAQKDHQVAAAAYRGVGRRRMADKVLLLILLFASASHSAAESTPDCSDNLVSLNKPLVEYPSQEQAQRWGLRGTSYLHVLIEGKSVFEYDVLPTGEVNDVRVTEATYSVVAINPQAFEEGHFDGFLETNLEPAVMKWTFEPIDSACTAVHSITWEFRDDA